MDYKEAQGAFIAQSQGWPIVATEEEAEAILKERV